MKKCSVGEFDQMLKTNPSCQVLDVRESAEYESENIKGTLHLPLSHLEKGKLPDLDKNKELYLLCLSGGRACRAAEKLERAGYNNLIVVDGGLSAWKESGKPVTFGLKRIWSLERQVRFTAGLLSLLGVLSSLWVHPAFIGISIFISCGLIFSAITNFCGMAMILARMPWNQKTKCSKS